MYSKICCRLLPIYAFVCLLLAAATVFGQSDLSSTDARLPISSALNANGSVNLGVGGTFDPSGFRMVTSPNGQPRFVPSDPSRPSGCTDGWDTTFSTNGVDNDVLAIVADGFGNIYIGGSFTSVQGLPASGIAKWDGTSWSALGSGVDGTVRALVAFGNDIYVGGSFSTAGGIPARNVAKWSNGSWSPMATGLGLGTHRVNALAVLENEIYAGGPFGANDGSPASGVARWNGTVWSQVGTDAPGATALLVKDGVMYAGTPGSGVKSWDGTAWSTVGTLTRDVRSLAVRGDELWAAGDMRISGNISQVAKWNGSAWTHVAVFNSTIPVWTLAVSGTDVYVGGSFTRQNGLSSTDGILKYNGTSWTGVGTGTEGGEHAVYALLPLGNTLYVGGDFRLAGGSAARNIATLTDGTTWSSFNGTGVDGSVTAIAVSGSDVYVGGAFTSAGTATANGIAKWNSVTNTWSPLGSGVSDPNGSIRAVAVSGNKVYVGGFFSSIGGVQAKNIAVWNGSTWAPLGTGVSDRVTVIIARGEDIYVGGAFQTAGGDPAKYVAKWNGNSWSALEGSIVPNEVSAMAFAGDVLYVGTPTTTVENPSYFLKYDGTTWTPLGHGMGAQGVSSIAVSGTDVYVAGGFTSIGGLTVNRVAKWNGSSWSALGGGLPNNFSHNVKLAMAGTNLIATGEFSVASGAPADRIAKWNGSAWSGLGTGLNANGSVVTAAGGDVFVGGSFTTAGCSQSPYFARWRQNVWTGVNNSDWHAIGNWGGGSVPPANGGVTISNADAAISSADVTVGSLVVSSGRALTVAAGRTLTVNGDLNLGSNASIAGPGTLVVNGDATLNLGNVTGMSAVTFNGNLHLIRGTISGNGPVNVTACRASAIAGGGSFASFISSPLVRCVTSSGTFRFPVGSGLYYSPVELFNVSGTGPFTVETKTGGYSGPAAGLPENRLQRWWNLTNGGISKADLNFFYVNSETGPMPNFYRVYRINNGVAELMPTFLNEAQNKATVRNVTSFSPWTMAQAEVQNTLKGRITTASGRAAERVIVTLRDGSGFTRYAVANHFGYYTFLGVDTSRTYTLSVRSKKFSFDVPERTIEFVDNFADQDFVSSDH